MVSDYPELMGAYGAALYAMKKSHADGIGSRFIGFYELNDSVNYTIKQLTCKGCTNSCQITLYKFKAEVKQKKTAICNDAIQQHKMLVLVAGHPYHADHLIHQQVSQMLADMGVSVINEEITSESEDEGFDSFHLISQWEYPNRIFQAAWWASQQKYTMGFMQLNSFGCGLDSVIMDEISDLVKRFGLSHAFIRVDEISSPGLIRLRLRSLVESLKLKTQKGCPKKHPVTSIGRSAVFDRGDKRRTILVPWFSDFYTPLIPALGKIGGYTIVNLPSIFGIRHGWHPKC